MDDFIFQIQLDNYFEEVNRFILAKEVRSTVIFIGKPFVFYVIDTSHGNICMKTFIIGLKGA
jgi:hypothetical protein